MPLDASSKERLIDGWLAMQRAVPGSSEYEELFWAYEELDDLCSSSPDDAWEIVLGVLARNPSDGEVGMLAAGPLEDLLARHGRAIIERVEREARHSLAFASLLGGVWQNTMADDIWARVRAVWDRRGWDDVPQA